MSLQDKLAAGQFVITAELVPPVSADPKALLRKARPLAQLADAINLTDGAGARVHLDALTAAGLLMSEGIEPVLQITCRDRNRIALQSLLLGAAALGVRNVLALAGDAPSAGDQPDAKAVFDLDSRRLLETARTMRDRGLLPHGREIDGRIEFFLGCADIPIDPPPGWRPDDLMRKLDAGAQFVQTQFCMDATIVRHYIERLAEHGILERAAILIGLGPLASARSARWMRTHLFGAVVPEPLLGRLETAADPRLEGRRICVELMREMQAITGVAGVHLMAPANDSTLPEVIQAFRAEAGASGAATEGAA